MQTHSLFYVQLDLHMIILNQIDREDTDAIDNQKSHFEEYSALFDRQ